MSFLCIACQKEVDGCHLAISCECVSDDNVHVGFVTHVFIYLCCHYFAITDLTFSSLFCILWI